MREVLTPNTASLFRCDRTREQSVQSSVADAKRGQELQIEVDIRFEVWIAFEVESSDQLFVTFGIEHPAERLSSQLGCSIK